MTQFRTFFIPITDDGNAQEELNAFLRSKRILVVDKAFTGNGWSFCAEWLEGGTPQARRNKPKVDYREVLSPKEFELFSRLRNRRKELAQRDGVQVYTIMTNEQLACVVQQNIKRVDDLSHIDGVGVARVEKYGKELLAVLADKGDVYEND